MITRGTIIGKIIDDLARLLSQIELRNKVGLLDLTKVSEDFFKELLNIVYDLNLTNLNGDRINEPGIDLGDLSKNTAYQITSTKTSDKINNTLEKVTKEQLGKYYIIKILIIGTKQSKYSIKKNLITKTKLNPEKNILDINDLTRDISTLNIDKLETLHTFFSRSFRELIIELEPMDVDGDFESSIYRYVEQIPNHPPKDLQKMDDYYGEPNDLIEYTNVYNKLASIPKSQREYICLIAERGKLKTRGLTYMHEIACTKLAGILGIEERTLFNRMAYLEDESVVYFSEDTDGHDRPNYKYQISSEYLNYIITFLKENGLSVRKTIVAMDFSVLGNV
ncbi:SMEK domain-containing protein [uncultured Dokdonia sp.]|uniref:SMEK domain-containing protein n=1 Tax=uncultured Dokdonia sp. TaxID=575653 RepID=UPI00261B3386|nr:SMEK domain-containing protein [uncultured Dokdonia sp.]